MRIVIDLTCNQVQQGSENVTLHRTWFSDVIGLRAKCFPYVKAKWYYQNKLTWHRGDQHPVAVFILPFVISRHLRVPINIANRLIVFLLWRDLAYHVRSTEFFSPVLSYAPTALSVCQSWGIRALQSDTNERQLTPFWSDTRQSLSRWKRIESGLLLLYYVAFVVNRSQTKDRTTLLPLLWLISSASHDQRRTSSWRLKCLDSDC